MPYRRVPDTAEDDLAQLHEHQRHGTAQWYERVVHAVAILWSDASRLTEQVRSTPAEIDR